MGTASCGCAEISLSLSLLFLHMLDTVGSRYIIFILAPLDNHVFVPVQSQQDQRELVLVCCWSRRHFYSLWQHFY